MQWLQLKVMNYSYTFLACLLNRTCTFDIFLLSNGLKSDMLKEHKQEAQCAQKEGRGQIYHAKSFEMRHITYLYVLLVIYQDIPKNTYKLLSF